jgi:hypothetical protein
MASEGVNDARPAYARFLLLLLGEVVAAVQSAQRGLT